jgi:hypothetical protein
MTFNAVLQKMVIGVGRQIQKQIVINKSLRPCANVFTAKSSCLLAKFTVAENGRHTFSGGGA